MGQTSSLITLLFLSLYFLYGVDVVNTKDQHAPGETNEYLSIPTDEYSAEELRLIEKTRESHAFEAEVNRLMNLIINSIYSEKEIFMRELISNAADALTKIRHISLTRPKVLQNTPDFIIRIRANPELNTLTLTDTGIGMTRQELVDNLGTIAQSGSSNFAKALTNSDKSNLSFIGQFGVGFYSSFLVADRVVVHSKSTDSDKQFVWASSSQHQYFVYEDPKQDLGRGTSIVLHLKNDSFKYLDIEHIRGLIKRYSEFVDFPIYLWAPHLEEIQSRPY